MASFKVKFRASEAEGRKGSIFYQITHGRRVRRLVTDYRILPSEWDGQRSAVVINAPDDRRAALISIRDRIRLDMSRLAKIIRNLDSEKGFFTADDIADEFRRYICEATLFRCMESQIEKLRRAGRIRTAETYSATLKSFREFRDRKDIRIDALTPEVMESYQTWHLDRGNTLNTISFYTRILRAVYNRAADEHNIDNINPFRHVYTGVAKTVKRAIPISSLRKIRALDLSGFPRLDFARDMFLISFFLRGMSFIDMAFLKKSDLKNGYLMYRRRKTGQRLSIAWTREMQLILDKYPANPTRYLLPIIKSTGINEHYAYRNSGYNINHNLKKIGRLAGLRIPLTMYVARHSWASAAKTNGIPLSVISEGMGHDNETTTRIYLASLDTSAVDQANAIIIGCI